MEQLYQPHKKEAVLCWVTFKLTTVDLCIIVTYFAIAVVR